ncbi:hypothetical protein ACF1BQ_010540 [Bradyrhizobium sp. RDT10]
MPTIYRQAHLDGGHAEPVITARAQLLSSPGAAFAAMALPFYEMQGNRCGLICFAHKRNFHAAACDKLARRANHPKSVQPFAQKYSAFVLTQITRITPLVSRQMRGVGHRHERAVRCDGRESCD